jgi:hypothetical protein
MIYKVKVKGSKKLYSVEANNREHALHLFEEQNVIVNSPIKYGIEGKRLIGHEKNQDIYEDVKGNVYSFDGKKMEEIKSKNNSPQYLIEGYRWFDKINGNTYHTVVITDLKTGEVIHRSPHVVYGYGQQWQHTAYDELKKKGLVKEEDRTNHELNRKRFIYSEHDVTRKKDLF